MAEVHINVDHLMKFAIADADYPHDRITGPVERVGAKGKWHWVVTGEPVETSDLICVNYTVPEMTSPH